APSPEPIRPPLAARRGRRGRPAPSTRRGRPAPARRTRRAPRPGAARRTRRAEAISITAVPLQEEIGVRCGARFVTYPELFERALRASRGLLELGVGGGDRVALLLRNSIEFLEASVATAPLGASAVPINW